MFDLDIQPGWNLVVHEVKSIHEAKEAINLHGIKTKLASEGFKWFFITPPESDPLSDNRNTQM